jgi:hypothetical protein
VRIAISLLAGTLNSAAAFSIGAQFTRDASSHCNGRARAAQRRIIDAGDEAPPGSAVSATAIDLASDW